MEKREAVSSCFRYAYIYESYAILFAACVVAASLAAIMFVYATVVSLTQLCACNQLVFFLQIWLVHTENQVMYDMLLVLYIFILLTSTRQTIIDTCLLAKGHVPWSDTLIYSHFRLHNCDAGQITYPTRQGWFEVGVPYIPWHLTVFIEMLCRNVL